MSRAALVNGALMGGIVAALAFAGAPAADADRAPTAEEAARIEAVLREGGYTRWGEIEYDDGLFEVDDAVATDGREYDLKLDENFAIVGREPD